MIIGWRSFAPNGTEVSGFLLFKLSFPAFKQQHFQKQETVCLAFVGDCYNVSNLLLRSFLFWKKEIPWEWGGNLSAFRGSLTIAVKFSLADRAFFRRAHRANAAIFMDQRLFCDESTEPCFFPHGSTPFFRWMFYELSFSALMSLFSRGALQVKIIFFIVQHLFSATNASRCAFFHEHGTPFSISRRLFPSWSTTLFWPRAYQVIVFSARSVFFSWINELFHPVL